MISKQTLDRLVVAFAVVATALVVTAYATLRLVEVSRPSAIASPAGLEGAGRSAPPLPRVSRA